MLNDGSLQTRETTQRFISFYQQPDIFQNECKFINVHYLKNFCALNSAAEPTVEQEDIEVFEDLLLISETVVEEEYFQYFMMDDGSVQERETSQRYVSFYRQPNNIQKRCRHVSVHFITNSTSSNESNELIW